MGVTRTRSVRVRALLALGIVLGVGCVATAAAFTDQARLTSGALQAGSVSIQVNGVDAWTATSLTASGMIPGNAVAVTVPVQRAVGSSVFTYAATGAVTTANALGTALRVKVYAGAASSGTSCPTTTQLAGGTAGVALAAAPTPLFTGRTALASPTAIPTVAQTDDLCVLVTLPSTAPVDAAGQSTTLTFAFNATTPGA